ncbi:methyltransferase domain-containing protein [Roseospira marina]|uniref:Methyltransferase domain-containing protein n=1 Tax=Roseospira marina TaxID=140057 RepID=A0A5M6IAJ6_9PROT|nr:methyltransferase domain-containing protein [Roseospira marina]KAA5605223.1 methyltransferase domain-containing protein [Roseospira marina]MBB4314678.1 sarcosine/dimethylglycine N-methyltransferase [Roseospira marina]MBB5087667.1 sarcosine/dimethylglycine N-methyltransferase [Roseospira marina]
MDTVDFRERNSELVAEEQRYGDDPIAVRDSDHYRAEYIQTFVEKWDELIDWEARAESEGRFFIDVLKARGKIRILDAACGTGFHSVQLIRAGFDVTSVDGSAAMLAKAFDNAKDHHIILRTCQADWRFLNKDLHGKYDAIICLGNSFTHLFEEQDRRRALAEFYAALKHDGVLIIDQRNYDAMIDQGYSSEHKYYYCGDKVVAEPEYVDEGLARFRYSFPDGSEYKLNMCPLRKNYMRRLLNEAGFQHIRTYGDFQETYQEDDPDFFIHVASKSYDPERGTRDLKAIATVAETYYDSGDADAFYYQIWGGEDIHIGLYEGTAGETIKDASRRTVDTMAEQVDLGPDSRVLDIGAGYGGAARRLAGTRGSSVHCLNISDIQNATNRRLTEEQGLSEKVTVVHGSFEDIPEPDRRFDVVWSQDAILHAGDRELVLEEAFRVLKPGGHLIFTDPMEIDDVPPGVLQPVYDRIHLENLGSIGFYTAAAQRVGFEPVGVTDLTQHLPRHYGRVAEVLRERYNELAKVCSRGYLDRMLVGLDNWVKAGEAGHLAWGILHFRKPE